MENFVFNSEIASKTIYLITIIMGWFLFIAAWRYHKADRIIRNFAKIYLVLTPLYTAFALMYVFNIYYQSFIGFFGWTTINTLFWATDGMFFYYTIKKLGTRK